MHYKVAWGTIVTCKREADLKKAWRNGKNSENRALSWKQAQALAYSKNEWRKFMHKQE